MKTFLPFLVALVMSGILMICKERGILLGGLVFWALVYVLHKLD